MIDGEFIDKHVIFKRGKENIGYGLEDKFAFKEEARVVDLPAYREYVSHYTPEYVERISGVKQADLVWLARLYGDPQKKVISFWTMGMNQHTRGTWINNLDRKDQQARKPAILPHRAAKRLRDLPRGGHFHPPPPGRHGCCKRRAQGKSRENMGASRRDDTGQAHLSRHRDGPGPGSG
jgi:hypothetical protein